MASALLPRRSWTKPSAISAASTRLPVSRRPPSRSGKCTAASPRPTLSKRTAKMLRRPSRCGCG
eukprot:8080725-Lingulodinium_polyedra.AAC.1